MPPQRDRLGRFLPGHSGGPGRPKGKRNPAYMNIVEEVITPEQWRTLVKRAEHWALGGDLDALKFLAAYLLGRPASAAPQQVERENQMPADNHNHDPLPSQLTEPPAQTSGAIKDPSQQPETEHHRDDEPIANSTKTRLVLRKRY